MQLLASSLKIMLSAVLAAFLSPSFVAAQNSSELEAIQQSLDRLRQKQDQMQDILIKITALLEKQANQPRPEVSLDLEGAPFRGNQNASITLVEFTDYQCPFCGRHAAETLPKIMAEYVNSGKIKYVLQDYPLESHPDARKAAEAAHCAGEQSRYWDMHDLIFANQKTLKERNLIEFAKSLGLNTDRFLNCLSTGKMSGQVSKDLGQAQAVGVDAAPTFYFALTTPNTTSVSSTTKISGAVSFENFKAALDKMIMEQAAPKKQ